MNPSEPHYFRRPALWTRVAVILAVLAALRYFHWRFEDTWNPVAPWFFVLFLAAELVGFGEVLLFFATTWRQRRHEPPVPRPGQSVDVYIATYNEPVSLLRDTAVCAVSLSYPHTTWILDDGNRPEVAALARELGCEYLARSDRSHAKAGNLNHALGKTTGDFVVTLDADHVPMPDLIERLLGFFEDPTVGLVQANQDFYNMDSFQHDTDWEDEAAWQQQELFFNVIQPGKDALDAGMYCGSPAMIRRAALEAVGGFATETVTEDMHTGLRMQKLGWRTVYSNQTVARGLAPQTFDAYDTQWHRWGLGAMQVLKLENPVFGRGLSFGQRLAYLSSFYFYWMSFQKLVYLVVPVFCVATGIFPLRTEPGVFFRYFLPYLAFNLAATAAMQGGFRGFVLTERYNLIKLGSMMQSVLGFLPGQFRFAVTPKAEGAAASPRRLLPYLALVAGLALAAVWGAVRAVRAPGEYELWAYAVNVFFSLFFLYLLVPVIVLALKRKESRRTYRFPQRLDLPVLYRVAHAPGSGWHQAFARNLNRFGMSITIDAPMATDTVLDLRLDLPEGPIVGQATVRWAQEISAAGRTRFANGLRFEGMTPDQHDAIARHLFWEIAPRHGEYHRLTTRSQAMEAA